MNDDTDFLKLYWQLGVQPGCTLEAFKQAYRRCVWELHPDRMERGCDESEGLKQLNMQYAAALAFHRLHSRLPGTIPAPAAPVATATPSRNGMNETKRRRPSAMPHRPPNRWLLLAFSIVATTPLWTLVPTPDGGATDIQRPLSIPPGGLSTPHPSVLQVGMGTATVAALMGVPIVDADDDVHWVYGPSWIRFECGQVVDWYSSLLQPLPVTDPRPATSMPGKKSAPQPNRCRAKPHQKSMVYPADTALARYSGVA